MGVIEGKRIGRQVNQIFTEHWQREIVSDKAADVMGAMYAQNFGEHYPAIKEFRELLQSLENKPEVIAYLLAKDPYSP